MNILDRLGQGMRVILWKAGRTVWKARLKRAVREADTLAAATGLRFMVFRMNGGIRVAPKRAVKDLVKAGRFRRGVTVRDIERNCLHITR